MISSVRRIHATDQKWGRAFNNRSALHRAWGDTERLASRHPAVFWAAQHTTANTHAIGSPNPYLQAAVLCCWWSLKRLLFWLQCFLSSLIKKCQRSQNTGVLVLQKLSIWAKYLSQIHNEDIINRDCDTRQHVLDTCAWAAQVWNCETVSSVRTNQFWKTFGQVLFHLPSSETTR